MKKIITLRLRSLLLLAFFALILAADDEGQPISWPPQFDFAYRVLNPFRIEYPALALMVSDSVAMVNRGEDLPVVHTSMSEDQLYFVCNAPFNSAYDYFPTMLSMPAYRQARVAMNYRKGLIDKALEKYLKKINPNRRRPVRSQNALSLVNTSIGRTSVSLNIKGNITIDGGVIFNNQEQTNTNFQDSKSWDLDINQTQKFNIEGNIGDRLSVLVDQNSESDFAWENNLELKYIGGDDDIWVGAHAGNISLSLPSTTFVSGGTSRSEGLFGVKLEHRLGPLAITSILSREQTNRSSRSVTGGASESEYTIEDNNFIVDRYFYVNEEFKRRFYPLTNEQLHMMDREYVIGNYELYRSTSSQSPMAGMVEGQAVLASDSSVVASGYWEKLTEGVDYEIIQDLGVIRMKNSVSSYALGIGYTIDYRDENGELVIAEEPEEWNIFGDYNYIYDGEEYEDLNDNDLRDPGELFYDCGLDSLCADDPEYPGPDEGEGDSLFTFIDTNGDELHSEGEPSEAFEDCGLDQICPDDDNWPGPVAEYEGNGVWDDAEPYTDANQNGEYDTGSDINLVLLKTNTNSTPSSATWSLMMKNVYYLGSTNIDVDNLELSISYDDNSSGPQQTHIGQRNLLEIFGLDKRNDAQNIDEPDGIIDNNPNLLNATYGELFLPFHLPFAYSENPRMHWPDGDYPVDQFNQATENEIYYGNSDSDLAGMLPGLDDTFLSYSDSTTGPAMYYSTNSNDINAEHAFNINVKSTTRSSVISLGGFMIVEGSEEVRLNGQLLTKGSDYSIDYFSGNITLLSDEAQDPSANITVNFEEREIVSFDQKVMAGTHMKWDINDNAFLGFSALYYNQSIVDDKVDIGYEPIRNFIWDINGKYSRSIESLTKAVDWLPLIETNKPSNMSVEGEFAQVRPNPNYLGEAFIDDFESAKRTTSPSLIQRGWKLAAPPVQKIDSFDGIQEAIRSRGKMAFYNPYHDYPTSDIWPELETSSQAGNSTTKILVLNPDLSGEESAGAETWGGITTALYSSDYDQSESKYLEIWINTGGEQTPTDLALHIDIGEISEDMNGNNQLDTEDISINGAFPNGLLDDGEDTGVDGCEDDEEDGYGSCLQGWTFTEALEAGSDFVNPLADPNDPNNDNWCYNSNDCPSTNDYSSINGTEGNGQMAGYTYPDTEDLNNNKAEDFRNDYFSYTIYPATDMAASESINDWKMYRVMLRNFEKQGEGDVNWSDVRSLRIWFDGINPEMYAGENNDIWIAKLEVVRNEWTELGSTHISEMEFETDSTFALAVANTDENMEYESPPGVTAEYDEYYGITGKEQSLVLDFSEGLDDSNMVAINKSLNLSGNKANNFFAYDYLEMYIHGGPIQNDLAPWSDDGLGDSTSVQSVFRIAQDEGNYYEIIKPIFDEWDNHNFIKIDVAELSQKKLSISSLEYFYDTGLDGVDDPYENGCGGALPEGWTYTAFRDSLDAGTLPDSLSSDIEFCDESDWEASTCSTCNENDPNGDNWLDCGLDNLCATPEDSTVFDADGSEGNGVFDIGEGGEREWGEEGNGQFEFNDEDGNEIHSAGEVSEPFEDYNANDIFDLPPDNYNEQFGYYEWFESSASGSWERIRIKGEPAINSINNIRIGVQNLSGGTVYGSVMVDELRMTGVRREAAHAFRMTGALNFADLLSLRGSYSTKDGNFHSLNQPISFNDTERSLNLDATLSPALLLPNEWGIKTDVSVHYGRNERIPMRWPGTDILVEDIASAPDSIKTLSNNYSVSTGFKKSSRSDRWWVKYTLDNVSNLRLSYALKTSSNQTVAENRETTIKSSGNYSWNFSKDNYLKPLKFMENWPFLGKPLSEFRLFYSPKNLGAKFNLVHSDKRSEQRSGNITENPKIDLTRDFDFQHQFSKTILFKYGKNLKNNLTSYFGDELEALVKLNPGQRTNLSENYSASFDPDFIQWLTPKFSYTSGFTHSYSYSDTLAYGNIATKTTFNASINVRLQNLVEKVYRPKNSSKSSRGRRRSGGARRNRRQSNLEPLIELKNPILIAIFSTLHKGASKVNPISFTYKSTLNYGHNNIMGEPDFLYRIGKNFDHGLELHPSQTPSFSKNSGANISVKSGLMLTQKISTTVNFTNSYSNTHKEGGVIDRNESISFFPLGDRGLDGFPMFNWTLNWNNLERMPIIKSLFKSVSASHGYTGSRDITKTNDEVKSSTLAHNFSPLVSLNMKTFGKTPFDIRLSYSNNLTINNIDLETTKKYTQSANMTISYRKTGGLTIPIPMLDNPTIENDITLSIKSDWNKSYQIRRQNIEGSFSPPEQQTSSWNIKPDLTYTFTKYVNGSLYFQYKFTDTDTSGESSEKNLGFKVNIVIRG